MRYALLCALLAGTSGCVTRTLAVTSAPAGARVTIDGHYVGTTPYTETFYSYGTRSLDLDLPGYVSLHELLPVPAPWWQTFPIDVVTDLLLPLGLRDDHAFHFLLLPLNPEAGAWEDARAAYAQEQAVLEAARRAEAEQPAPAEPAEPAGSQQAEAEPVNAGAHP